VPDAASAHAQYSDDGGLSWQTGSGNKPDFAHYVTLLLPTGRIVLLGSLRTAYSDDYGNTWTEGPGQIHDATVYAGMVLPNSVLSTNGYTIVSAKRITNYIWLNDNYGNG
jgi:hypothetical protein